MTAIKKTGTFTRQEVPELNYSSGVKGLGFYGTFPTTLTLGFIDPDDKSTFRAFTGGVITTDGTTFDVTVVPTGGLALQVTGGSPDFSIVLVGNTEQS